MVSEKAGVGSELSRLVSNLSDSSTAARMLPDTQEATPKPTEAASTEPQRNADSSAAPRRLSLKKWRSAEQQVLSLLDLKGWDVDDVSRQNVGYDIEGLTPEGFFLRFYSRPIFARLIASACREYDLSHSFPSAISFVASEEDFMVHSRNSPSA